MIEPGIAPGDVYSSFYEYIVHVLDRSLEKKDIKPNSQFPRNVWFDDECKNLKTKLHLLYKQFRSDDSTSHAEHNSIIDLERKYKRTTQRKNENLEKIYFVTWKSWTAVIPASIGDFGSLCKIGHHKAMPLMRPLLQCTIKLATILQIAQSLITLIWMKLKTSFCIMTQLMKLT